MATYYIDFTNGSDANDGLGTGAGNAWQTIDKFTENARSAADICYVRGGMTTTQGSDITFTSDGSIDADITLQGCYDGVTDPWGDGATTRPVVDFNSGSFQFNFSTAQGWIVEALDIENSTDGNGALFMRLCRNIIIRDCLIHDNVDGVVPSLGTALIDNCDIYDNSNDGVTLQSSSGSVYIQDSNIYGNTGSGLFVAAGYTAWIKNTVFGGAAALANGADIEMSNLYAGWVYGRNVKLDSATQVANMSSVARGPDGGVFIEDDEQTQLAWKGWQYSGNAERSAAVERSGSGGTAWSILMTPNSNCGLIRPFYGIGDWLRGIPIYLDGTSQTVTIYAYATSWTGLPSVSEFVVELEHYEGAGDWAIDTSADTFAANDQWESFAITLTPSAAGPAYLRVKLGEYEDGTEKIYIDPAPVIS